MCSVGFAAKYEIDSFSQLPVTVCAECPVGTVCDERGLVFDELAAAVGYWQGGDGTYYRCLLPSQCLGGQGQAVGCAANREGPLCALCKDGYTASSTDGSCEVCKTNGNAVFFTSIVAIFVICVMLFQYYFVLWTSATLLDAARVEDQVIALPSTTLTKEEYDLVRQLRYERYITTDGPPPPKAEVLYKLKILLTFIQILTNLSLSLQINYPQQYLTFVNYFNPANLDFVSFTAADCVSSAINGYFEFYVWLLTPICLIALLVSLYLLPFTICKRGAPESDHKRRRRETYRLIMFTLFLVYPSVCSSVCSIFICKTVEGVHYLVADFSLNCFNEQWNSVSKFAIAAIFVYPIGVPLFFLLNLLRYHFGKMGKSRLQEKGIRAQLGFLYDCYETRVWFFEMIDMAHKLTMTSLVAFFPELVQLAIGMVVLAAYLIILLLLNPYIRTGDDRLHLVAQTELLLLLMAGNCFQKDIVPTDSINWTLTFVLISMVISFMIWWGSSVLNVVKKMIAASKDPCGEKMRQWCRIKSEERLQEQEKSSNPIIGEKYVLDRETVTSARTRIMVSLDGVGDVKDIKFGNKPPPLDTGHKRSRSEAAIRSHDDPLGFGPGTR